MADSDRVLGVYLRQLRIAADLYIRRFSEAADAAVRMDAASGLSRIWNRGASGGRVSPLIEYLLDRFPARRIILPCITIFGCAFASLSLMTNHLWHFYAIFLVLGIVGNGTAHLACSRVLTTWFEERRGGAFAVVMTGSAIGAMVLPRLKI